MPQKKVGLGLGLINDCLLPDVLRKKFAPGRSEQEKLLALVSQLG